MGIKSLKAARHEKRLRPVKRVSRSMRVRPCSRTSQSCPANSIAPERTVNEITFMDALYKDGTGNCVEMIKKAADIIVSMTRGLSWNDRDDVLMYFISELLKMD